MNLSQINHSIQKRKRPKRVGRGVGSGHGKTSGRGHKGQGQLAGWRQNSTFEGGRMPLVRRIPKRGFHNQWGAQVAIVNLGDIDEAFDAGAEVTPDTLRESGVVKGRYDQLKVLSSGDLTKKLKISAHRFSKAALEKIQKAGAEAITIAAPAPVVRNKQKQ
jgi:large subunit ribosomal protein L15